LTALYAVEAASAIDADADEDEDAVALLIARSGSKCCSAVWSGEGKPRR
jgi:hypothetical protein